MHCRLSICTESDDDDMLMLMMMMLMMMIMMMMVKKLRLLMILQDSNAPVALRVVTGGVKERDSDHSNCRGYCQRSDPPVELKLKIKKRQIKI